MNITNKRTLIVLVLFVVGVLVSSATWWSIKHTIRPAVLIRPETPVIIATSSIQEKASSSINLKTYINANFGFKFQYPYNWTIRENTFYSPFSKFNLMSWPSAEKLNSFNPPLLINVVTPDFVNSGFSSLNGHEVIVAGMPGKEYEYIHDGLSEIDIILQLGDNRIILGANKNNKNDFNKIISTFEFLK